jgi:hypothetical protein
MKSPILPTLTIVLLSAAGAALWLSDGGRPPAPEAALVASAGEAPGAAAARGAGTTAPRAGELEGVKEELAELQDRLGEVEETVAEVPLPVEDSPEGDDGDAWSARAATRYDEVVEVQPVDPEWSPVMRQHIQEFMSGGQRAGIHSGAADCRSTICRVEVNAQSRDDRDRLVADVSAMLEPEAEAFLHIEDDEDLDITIYVARGGTTLPPVTL